MIRQMLAAVLISAALPAFAQNSTELHVKLPALPGEQEAETIYCRPPMELPGRRLLGPKTCRPQREWDEMHKKGLDLAPDGKTVVGSEKYRSVQCGSTGC